VILMDAETFAAPPGSRRPSAGGKSQADTFAASLASLGIPAHTLRQGDIQPNLASYGELSRWEFKTLGTGRAIARRTPRIRLSDPQKSGEPGGSRRP
jgi:hypothetical protein